MTLTTWRHVPPRVVQAPSRQRSPCGTTSGGPFRPCFGACRVELLRTVPPPTRPNICSTPCARANPTRPLRQCARNGGATCGPPLPTTALRQQTRPTALCNTQGAAVSVACIRGAATWPMFYEARPGKWCGLGKGTRRGDNRLHERPRHRSPAWRCGMARGPRNCRAIPAARLGICGYSRRQTAARKIAGSWSCTRPGPNGNRLQARCCAADGQTRTHRAVFPLEVVPPGAGGRRS
mmetsp:Transcript_89553/g.252358  ORF Transcript_89553/g.252358 Transcript_89553/m.252358 type:complete len:236 (+) Transcript_89553:276-983(+)